MTETPSEPTNDNVIPLGPRPTQPIERSEGSDHTDDEGRPCPSCGLYHFELGDIIESVKHQVRRAVNDGTRSVAVHTEDMQEIFSYLDYLHEEVHGDD